MRHRKAWGILSGPLLLPFTIRATRSQAILDYAERHTTGRPVLTSCTPGALKKVFPGVRVVRVKISWE